MTGYRGSARSLSRGFAEQDNTSADDPYLLRNSSYRYALLFSGDSGG